MKSPKRKAVTTVYRCSECGLDWEKHGDKPTLEDCVRLLRADRQRLSQFAESTTSFKPKTLSPLPYQFEAVKR